jgi:hypothetical protein
MPPISRIYEREPLDPLPARAKQKLLSIAWVRGPSSSLDPLRSLLLLTF